jgi:putative AdoMet-dependent methyltransferase
MNKGDQSTLFDNWADYYNWSVRQGGFPFDGYEQVLDEIVRDARVDAGMTVLDLGIGTGNLAARLAERCCRLWGLDFSSAMLSKARAALPEVTLVQAGLQDKWPSALDRRFDRIVSAYALHHLDLAGKVALLVKLTGKHLAPAGRIVVGDIAFPTAKDREEAHQRLIGQWDNDEFYWAADETAVACRHVGLESRYTQVSSCGGVFAFWPTPTEGAGKL